MFVASWQLSLARCAPGDPGLLQWPEVNALGGHIVVASGDPVEELAV
jgi:hypothetical protein